MRSASTLHDNGPWASPTASGYPTPGAVCVVESGLSREGLSFSRTIVESHGGEDADRQRT